MTGEPGGWARTETRFARRKTLPCTTCHTTIDEEPYTHTVCTDGYGGLTAWNLCRNCTRAA